ncbi:n-acetylglutamate synthase [Priestia megaterium]|nr:n-acetylglutamate synthase [Priestia megaterium]
MDYGNRIFKSISNTDNGEVSNETVFHYQQQQNIVHATYSGGDIVYGALVGTIDENSCLTFRYQHANTNNELRRGQCFSTPELLADGRIRLHEKWQWLDYEKTTGESMIEEVVHT